MQRTNFPLGINKSIYIFNHGFLWLQVVDSMPTNEKTASLLHHLQPLYLVMDDMPRPPESLVALRGGQRPRAKHLHPVMCPPLWNGNRGYTPVVTELSSVTVGCGDSAPAAVATEEEEQPGAEEEGGHPDEELTPSEVTRLTNGTCPTVTSVLPASALCDLDLHRLPV